jgi:serine-type D-Ala-D-Ala carboxypeptidase/endopeptidase (penicillin-binding protein 4)
MNKTVPVFLNSFLLPAVLLLASCSMQKRIGRLVNENILQDSLFRNAHTGISIYDPARQQYIYNYNAEKYFIPASNVKIATCYAGMKYLGDSLAGIKFTENDSAVFIIPSGDPTFLHPDFPVQPVITFLKQADKRLYVSDANWKAEALGSGWSWDDYNDYYMAERSALPVYGNVIRWMQSISKKENPQYAGDTLDSFIYSEPEINWEVKFAPAEQSGSFSVKREKDENIFTVSEGKSAFGRKDVPFVTKGLQSALELLKDTVHKELIYLPRFQNSGIKPQIISSRHTDSLLKPMMHQSDNFFAEQTLLMVSNRLLGVMNDVKLIDTLLASELKGFPQKPRWADGSGLSRYNLFTPQDFVWLLDKMKKEFAIERLKSVFPTGGTGTLRNYYKQDSGFIYAKTGTLNGVVALSGFLLTQHQKLLVFSVLVNNHQSSAALLRRKIEAFLHSLAITY